MASSCNATQENGWGFFCMSSQLHLLFGAISAMLVLSLSWNIFFCVSKCCSGKGTCQSRIRRRSTRQMEENPIYGNISYMQASPAVFTEVEPPLRDEQRVNSDSQSKTQDCYANLTLKAPRPQSGRSSPQIHYSDVVHLEEIEKEDDGNTDAISTVSDLYASVQNQHTKTINTADSGEDYANHF